jgi:hypothetical protein
MTGSTLFSVRAIVGAAMATSTTLLGSVKTVVLVPAETVTSVVRLATSVIVKGGNTSPNRVTTVQPKLLKTYALDIGTYESVPGIQT